MILLSETNIQIINALHGLFMKIFSKTHVLMLFLIERLYGLE